MDGVGLWVRWVGLVVLMKSSGVVGGLSATARQLHQVCQEIHHHNTH